MTARNYSHDSVQRALAVHVERGTLRAWSWTGTDYFISTWDHEFNVDLAEAWGIAVGLRAAEVAAARTTP